jgi:outer membrane protein assembly factor BamB
MLENIIKRTILIGATIISAACSSTDQPAKQASCEEFEKIEYYLDQDGDGYGSKKANPTWVCEGRQKAGYVINHDDCNDLNNSINPSVDELCDGIDNNCNEKTDEGLDKNCETTCGKGYTSCVKEGENYVEKCSAQQPQPEVCDDIDNNCNGITDEGLPYQLFFKDQDNDGDGDNSISKSACKQPEGFVANNYDCDDNNPNIKKGAVLWRVEDIKCKNSLDALALSANNKDIYVIDKDGMLHNVHVSETGIIEAKGVFGEAEQLTLDKEGNIYVLSNGHVKALEQFLGYNEDLLSSLFTQKWLTNITKCIKDVPEKTLFSELAVSLTGDLYLSSGFYDSAFGNEACSQISVLNNKGELFSKKMSFDGWWGVEDSFKKFFLSLGQGEKVYALDSKTGSYQSLSTDLSNVLSEGKLDIPASPIIFGKGGNFYILRKQEKYSYGKWDITWAINGYSPKGELLFSIPSQERVPIIDEKGNIYGYNLSNELSCYDSQDGKGLWKKQLTAPATGAVIVSSSTVYHFDHSGLYALNTENGDTRWKLEVDPLSKIAISPANMVVGETGILYFCNAVDNKVYAVCANEPLDPKAYWPMHRHDNQRTNNVNTEIK